MIETQSHRHEIVSFESMYDSSVAPIAFEIGAETLRLERNTPYPDRDREVIECAIEEKEINQYTLLERYSYSRDTTASSESKTEQLLFLVREGDQWRVIAPERKKAQPRRNDSKYAQTKVDGVEVTKVFSRGRAGRGEKSSKKRYKITRDVVQSYDEVWMVAWRDEEGGSRNGSYSRRKEQTATRLLVQNDE